MHVCMYITLFFWSFILSSYLWYNRYQQISLSHSHAHTHTSGVELPGCFIWSRFIAFSHYLRVGLQLIPAEQSLMYEKQLTINTFQPQRLILPLMHLSLQAYTQIVSPLLLFCVSLSHTLSLHSLMSSYSDHSRYYWGAFRAPWNNQVCPHPFHLSLQTDPLKISPVYLIIIH